MKDKPTITIRVNGVSHLAKQLRGCGAAIHRAVQDAVDQAAKQEAAAATLAHAPDRKIMREAHRAAVVRFKPGITSATAHEILHELNRMGILEGVRTGDIRNYDPRHSQRLAWQGCNGCSPELNDQESPG